MDSLHYLCIVFLKVCWWTRCRASYSINKSSLKVDLRLVQINRLQNQWGGSFIATTYSNILGSCVLQWADLCTLPHIQSYSACNQQHTAWISSSEEKNYAHHPQPCLKGLQLSLVLPRWFLTHLQKRTTAREGWEWGSQNTWSFPDSPAIATAHFK